MTDRHIADESALDLEATGISAEPITQWKLFWTRFTHHRLAMISAMVLGFIVGVAVFAPIIPGLKDPLELFVDDRGVALNNLPPRGEFIFGTDQLGRDLLARIVYGGRESKRKSSGSYYTPDYIVQYIVENTLGPLVRGECRPDAEPLHPELKKLKTKRMSEEAQGRVKKELKKLRMMHPTSAEATVVRNYVDWIMGLPWGEKTEERFDGRFEEFANRVDEELSKAFAELQTGAGQ